MEEISESFVILQIMRRTLFILFMLWGVLSMLLHGAVPHCHNASTPETEECHAHHGCDIVQIFTDEITANPTVDNPDSAECGGICGITPPEQSSKSTPIYIDERTKPDPPLGNEGLRAPPCC